MDEPSVERRAEDMRTGGVPSPPPLLPAPITWSNKVSGLVRSASGNADPPEASVEPCLEGILTWPELAFGEEAVRLWPI